MKQEGLYQNKVTLSLASIHNCKMALYLPCSRLMPTLSIWHHRTFRQFFSLVHVVTLSWPRELQLVPYSNTRKQKRWNSAQFQCTTAISIRRSHILRSPWTQSPDPRPANGKRGFWSKDAFDSLESFHSFFMDITHIISWSATLSQFGLLSTGM